MSVCLFLVRVRISATRGMFENMSLSKTRAPGEKFQSVETGLQRRAYLAVPIASSTSFSAVFLLVDGFRLMSVRMI